MKIKIITYDLELEKSIDSKFKSKTPDIIVPIGGDGTFISAIEQSQEAIKNNIPFYGIANGTLNFLMNKFQYSDINMLLELISRKEDIEFIKTPILHYYINNSFMGVAVNEVVYGDSIRDYPKMKIGFSNYCEAINGSIISISSPIGSTGLNKNINGKIIPTLDCNLININTIATDKEIHKTINNKRIFITQLKSRKKIKVLADNKVVYKMKNNDVLMVMIGDYITIGFDSLKEFNTKRVLSAMEE